MFKVVPNNLFLLRGFITDIYSRPPCSAWHALTPHLYLLSVGQQVYFHAVAVITRLIHPVIAIAPVCFLVQTLSQLQIMVSSMWHSHDGIHYRCSTNMSHVTSCNLHVVFGKEFRQHGKLPSVIGVHGIPMRYYSMDAAWLAPSLNCTASDTVHLDVTSECPA